MDRRYLTFFVLSAIVIVANLFVSRLMNPPQPPKVAQNAAGGDKKDDADNKGEAAKKADAKNGDQAAEKGKAEAERPADAKAAPVAPARQAAPEQRVTLGSMDPASDYRMLVTLNNRGAAVERVELNSPRYHDTHWDDRNGKEDESGYLGHLAPKDAPNNSGAEVQLVGPGTPAAAAGIKPGDVITAIDNAPVRWSDDLDGLLRKHKIGTTVSLTIAGRAAPLSVKLAPRPVQVLRPEEDDALSFLATLDSVD